MPKRGRVRRGAPSAATAPRHARTDPRPPAPTRIDKYIFISTRALVRPRPRMIKILHRCPCPSGLLQALTPLALLDFAQGASCAMEVGFASWRCSAWCAARHERTALPPHLLRRATIFSAPKYIRAPSWRSHPNPILEKSFTSWLISPRRFHALLFGKNLRAHEAKSIYARHKSISAHTQDIHSPLREVNHAYQSSTHC